MTVGFLPGRSDYESEPGTRSDTRGAVSSAFCESSYVGIGWGLWGFLPHFLPSQSLAIPVQQHRGGAGLGSPKRRIAPSRRGRPRRQAGSERRGLPLGAGWVRVPDAAVTKPGRMPCRALSNPTLRTRVSAELRSLAQLRQQQAGSRTLNEASADEDPARQRQGSAGDPFGPEVQRVEPFAPGAAVRPTIRQTAE